MGRNNLIIDLDPQGNATTGLGKNNNDEDSKRINTFFTYFCLSSFHNS